MGRSAVAALTAGLLIACSGSDEPDASVTDTGSADATTTPRDAGTTTPDSGPIADAGMVDMTAPTVVITDDVDVDIASGPVTFTFTFDEDITTDFDADSVTVTGGTKGTFGTETARISSLVVTPDVETTGTISVTVGVGAFMDLAGNANTVAVTVDQAYDTRIPPMDAMDLPVTFDEASVVYGLAGFGGAEDSTIVVDPTDGTNMVAKVIKSATAELWAGTTLTADGTIGFATRIPIDIDNTRMTVRVWSPDSGIQVRLKIEAANDPTISVETEATTTMAASWEVLTFDFINEAPGTAALDVSRNYDKASVFFNFGVDGATAGEKTYYFDDMIFIGGTGAVQPGAWDMLTFDDPNVTITLTGFGGAEDSTIVPDPTNATNQVGRVVKNATAQLWAGTTVSTGMAQSVAPLPIDAMNTRMTVMVYSPDVGIPVRLKAEDSTNPTITVETEAMTTMANAWETLTFDFVNEASGTAALNVANTYDKISLFFNFGTDGATAGEKIYLFDDIAFIGGTGGVQPGTFDPITFEDPLVTYTLTGFGGAEDSTVVVDPTNGANQVARVVKNATAQLWAGTTVSTGPMESVPTIPLSAASARMTVRVWSPDANIQVRLKVETAGDPTRSVETEATVTTVAGWQTLTFDFTNQAAGTAALNLTYTYNKVSIFFNFGVDGATAGAKIYFFDDVSYLP